VRNQRARNKNKFFSRPGSDAEQAAASKQNGIIIFVEEGPMFVKVISMSIIGMESYPVFVEVDISQGLPQFATVGLPDASVKESRDRIKAAIKNSGYRFPAAMLPST